MNKIGKEDANLENIERRRLILRKLKSSSASVTGRELAELCGVSRQIIVSDIAMLVQRGRRSWQLRRAISWKGNGTARSGKSRCTALMWKRCAMS